MTKLTKEKLIELADQIKNEQNFLAAISLGIPTVMICGSFLGIVTYYSSAIGLVFGILTGVMIGYVIREVGKGINIQFSILAAVLTCCAIILGEMMAGAVEGALYYNVNPWEAFFYQTIEERWTRYWGQVTIPEIGSLIIAMAFSTKYALRKLSKLQ